MKRLKDATTIRYLSPSLPALVSPQICLPSLLPARTGAAEVRAQREIKDFRCFPSLCPNLRRNTYAYEQTPMVKPTGFREYDARWLFEKEINLMGVQALGLGLGTLLHEFGVRPEIVTGHDFRSYSASIKHALATGLDGGGHQGARHRPRAFADGLFRPIRPRRAGRRHGHRLA